MIEIRNSTVHVKCMVRKEYMSSICLLSNCREHKLRACVCNDGDCFRDALVISTIICFQQVEIIIF